MWRAAPLVLTQFCLSSANILCILFFVVVSFFNRFHIFKAFLGLLKNAQKVRERACFLVPHLLTGSHGASERPQLWLLTGALEGGRAHKEETMVGERQRLWQLRDLRSLSQREWPVVPATLGGCPQFKYWSEAKGRFSRRIHSHEIESSYRGLLR